MKSDLDSLMTAQNLEAILITGPAQHNPPMVYLTGQVHMTGDLIKKRGAPPVLFCNPMEREEAARSGLQTRNLADYPMKDLLQQADGNTAAALAMRYKLMLADLGVSSGRVALYGRIDAGASYGVFSTLQQILPEVTLVGEYDNSTLIQARETKDEAEIDRIRHMGKVTTTVVGQVAEFLSSHKAHKEVLVKKNGEPLTIGDVKTRINLWLTELDAEAPEGVIFAIGRDAGVPHSSGTATDLLHLGQSIVFDIFPCERGGGYYYDFTRTWSLGYAPDELISLHETVLQAYNQVMGSIEPGAAGASYQKLVCDLFEAAGHPTVQSDPKTTSGYVHGLGHGVGLQVHERPALGSRSTEKDVIRPGIVFTVEPGLYYPEKGMGVRLEDTVWIRPDGQMEIFAKYPLDLVIPVKK
jgi:Xaa-Pro aminopeptidase